MRSSLRDVSSTASQSIGAQLHHNGITLTEGTKGTTRQLKANTHFMSKGLDLRLTNDDVADLYNLTPVGTKVIVLAEGKPAPR